MRELLLAFSLLLATSSGVVASPSQGRVLRHDLLLQPAADTCTDGQYVCNEACDQLSLCVLNSQGVMEVVPLEACPGGSRCSAELHRCVDRPTACGASTGGGITCHATGAFPDPLNCSLYHVCAEDGAVSTVGACEPGYAYNALTGDCSFRTTDSVCTDGPTPPCIREGQSGAVAANPSIYYVCVSDDNILTPNLYRCADGQIYDPEVASCVDSTW